MKNIPGRISDINGNTWKWIVGRWKCLLGWLIFKGELLVLDEATSLRVLENCRVWGVKNWPPPPFGEVLIFRVSRLPRVWCFHGSSGLRILGVGWNLDEEMLGCPHCHVFPEMSTPSIEHHNIRPKPGSFPQLDSWPVSYVKISLPLWLRGMSQKIIIILQKLKGGNKEENST